MRKSPALWIKLKKIKENKKRIKIQGAYAFYQPIEDFSQRKLIIPKIMRERVNRLTSSHSINAPFLYDV